MGWGAATRLRLRQWRRGIHAGVGERAAGGAGCGGVSLSASPASERGGCGSGWATGPVIPLRLRLLLPRLVFSRSCSTMPASVSARHADTPGIVLLLRRARRRGGAPGAAPHAAGTMSRLRPNDPPARLAAPQSVLQSAARARVGSSAAVKSAPAASRLVLLPAHAQGGSARAGPRTRGSLVRNRAVSRLQPAPGARLAGAGPPRWEAAQRARTGRAAAQAALRRSRVSLARTLAWRDFPAPLGSCATGGSSLGGGDGPRFQGDTGALGWPARGPEPLRRAASATGAGQSECARPRIVPPRPSAAL